MKNLRDDGYWERIIVGIILVVASAVILARVLPASKRGDTKARTETAESSKAKMRK